jgi:hypothetical protein
MRPTRIRQLSIPAEIDPRTMLREAMPTAGAAAIMRFEEHLKLRYHFGGRCVLAMDDPEGRVVIAAATPGSGELRQALDQLSAEERRNVCIEFPEPWPIDTPSFRDGLLAWRS